MKFILPLLIFVFITGCAVSNNVDPKKLKKETLNNNNFETMHMQKQDHVYSNLNTTIINIAEQLFDTKLNKKNPSRLILTSFVDLDNLENTSTFGRLISESMFNELHIRKFLVTDFRGQEAVSVNEDGEFHISRDADKLKDIINEVEYILVGTYVKFENQSLLINARILDSISGNVFSSARVIYRPKDCSLFNICIKKNQIESNRIKNQLFQKKSVVNQAIQQNASKDA